MSGRGGKDETLLIEALDIKKRKRRRRRRSEKQVGLPSAVRRRVMAICLHRFIISETETLRKRILTTAVAS